MDPNPAIFISDLQDVNQKFVLKFFCFLLIEVIFTSFFKDESHKEVTK